MKKIEKYINYTLATTVISLILFTTLSLLGAASGSKEISYLNLGLSFLLINLLSLNYVMRPKSKLSKFLPVCIKEVFA